MPVTSTTGEPIVLVDGTWRVPKWELFGVVQILLESKWLTFPTGAAKAQNLIQELLDSQVKITAVANDTYGACNSSPTGFGASERVAPRSRFC